MTARGFPGKRVDAQRAGIRITDFMSFFSLSRANGEGSGAADYDLMRRITIVLLFVLVFTTATSQLYRMYAKKFFDVTGPAKWIWASHQISRNVPVTFYAVREFDL